MRTVVVVAIFAAVAGFVGGLVISEVVGVIGYLLFDSPVGLGFLPVYVAVACAAVAAIVQLRRRPPSQRERP